MSIIFGHPLAQLIFQYRYIVLYPAAIIEGPLMAIAAGFFVSAGVMSLIPAFIIVVTGDITSDLLFYYLGWLGKNWRRAYWFIKKFDFESKKNWLIRLFECHGGKIIILGKLTQSLAGIFLMGMGYLKINLKRVLWYSFVGAFVKTVVLFYVGYFAGSAYEKYAGNFKSLTIILSAVTIIFIVIFFHLPNRIINKIIGFEENNIVSDAFTNEKNNCQT